MPETIRRANGGLRWCPRRGGILAAFVSVSSMSAIAPAQADGLLPAMMHGVAALSYGPMATVTLLLNLAWFSVVAGVLLRQRRALSDGEHSAREERSALQAECDRLKALLTAEPQVLIAWAAGAEFPEIIGDSALILQGEPPRVLAFGSWLDAASAQQIEHAVDDLRAKGRAFVMNLTTRSGRPVEADGRAIGGVATLRLRDVSGLERELADLENRHAQLANDVATMRGLLDALSAPVGGRGGAAHFCQPRLCARRGGDRRRRRGCPRIGIARRQRPCRRRTIAQAGIALHCAHRSGRQRRAGPLRRDRRARRKRQRRHCHRPHRNGGHARRAQAHAGSAPPRAQSTRDRCRGVQHRSQAHLLQYIVPRAVRPRARCAR